MSYFPSQRIPTSSDRFWVQIIAEPNERRYTAWVERIEKATGEIVKNPLSTLSMRAVEFDEVLFYLWVEVTKNHVERILEIFEDGPNPNKLN